MVSPNLKNKLGYLFSFSLLIFFTQAQIKDYRRDPVGLVYKKSKDLYFKITYTRPFHAYDRGTIWGARIKYRRLWRTGGDEVPEITLTDTVLFGEDTLPPGTYSLLTIPDTVTWTVIINSGQGQRGLFQYRAQKDLFRTAVRSYDMSKFRERFTIDIKTIDERNFEIVLLWGKKAVIIPVFYEPD